MRMQSIKAEHDRAVEFKRRNEGMKFCIELIRGELVTIMTSPDFKKLPEDTKEAECISRAKAIVFWTGVKAHYEDEYLKAMINTAARIDMEELNITLDQAMHIAEGGMIDIPEKKAEQKPVPATPVKGDPKSLSDDEMLDQLMARQDA